MVVIILILVVARLFIKTIPNMGRPTKLFVLEIS